MRIEYYINESTTKQNVSSIEKYVYDNDNILTASKA